MTYFDTSVILSLYVFEGAFSSMAAALVTRAGSPILVNEFQLHEARTAIRLQEFRGKLRASEVQRSLARLEYDLESGLLQLQHPVWSEVFEMAEAISGKHASSLGVRSADILHVALAKNLGANQFETFDNRQKALATVALGL